MTKSDLTTNIFEAELFQVDLFHRHKRRVDSTVSNIPLYKHFALIQGEVQYKHPYYCYWQTTSSILTYPATSIDFASGCRLGPVPEETLEV